MRHGNTHPDLSVSLLGSHAQPGAWQEDVCCGGSASVPSSTTTRPVGPRLHGRMAPMCTTMSSATQMLGRRARRCVCRGAPPHRRRCRRRRRGSTLRSGRWRAACARWRRRPSRAAARPAPAPRCCSPRAASWQRRAVQTRQGVTDLSFKLKRSYFLLACRASIIAHAAVHCVQHLGHNALRIWLRICCNNS